MLILQYFLDTDTDTASVFFRLNTDTDTSVFENHTGYWILVFLFCTGQVSEPKYCKTQIFIVKFLAKFANESTEFAQWNERKARENQLPVHKYKSISGPRYFPIISSNDDDQYV